MLSFCKALFFKEETLFAILEEFLKKIASSLCLSKEKKKIFQGVEREIAFNPLNKIILKNFKHFEIIAPIIVHKDYCLNMRNFLNSAFQNTDFSFVLKSSFLSFEISLKGKEEKKGI